MQVQTNSSYLFSNPFGTPSFSSKSSFKEISQSGEIDQLQNDYNLISQELNLSEKKLYHTLINDQNYQAAKGIVAVGFIRAAGVYQDADGNPLSGQSLIEDLTKLAPSDSIKEQNALKSLQDYLTLNPSAMELNPVQRGNLLDLKI